MLRIAPVHSKKSKSRCLVGRMQIQLYTPSQTSAPLRSVSGNEARDQAGSLLPWGSGGDERSSEGGIGQAGLKLFE